MDRGCNLFRYFRVNCPSECDFQHFQLHPGCNLFCTFCVLCNEYAITGSYSLLFIYLACMQDVSFFAISWLIRGHCCRFSSSCSAFRMQLSMRTCGHFPGWIGIPCHFRRKIFDVLVFIFMHIISDFFVIWRCRGAYRAKLLYILLQMLEPWMKLL